MRRLIMLCTSSMWCMKIVSQVHALLVFTVRCMHYTVHTLSDVYPAHGHRDTV